MTPPAVSLEEHRDGSLAGGAGRNETPPAFLIQRSIHGEFRIPLKFIPNHAPENTKES